MSSLQTHSPGVCGGQAVEGERESRKRQMVSAPRGGEETGGDSERYSIRYEHGQVSASRLLLRGVNGQRRKAVITIS